MTKKVYGSFTNILYPRQSFLTGAMSTLNLFGISTTYNVSDSEDEADAKALYSDWLTTGNDIRNVIQNDRK